MIHPLRAWNRFFFSTVSAKPLGAIRIIFGLLALSNLAFLAVDLDLWFTDIGMLRGNEAWTIAGPLQLSPLVFYQSPLAIRIAFGLTAFVALMLTIGWRTKLMSILFYFGMLSIHNRNLVSSSGADVLLMTFVFNLMLSPCGAAYSVDAWLKSRRRGTAADPVILSWSLRLIQIQISLIYACAAILKTGGGLWLNGTALHYVLTNTEVIRFNLGFLTEYPVLINLMTYSALVMEFSLAFFIWFRAARPFVLYLGLMLHSGIVVTINIPLFGELMWMGYLAFMTPPEFTALLHAVDARRLFARSGVKVVVDPGEEKIAEPLPALIPALSYRASSIIVRIDAASALIGPHSIDVSPARFAATASAVRPHSDES